MTSDDSRPPFKRQRSDLEQLPEDRSNSIPKDGISEPFDLSSLGKYATEPLDYPRRRAVVACEICRSRKSRCDGARPRCKLCTDLDAECVYREPGVKLDAGDRLILEQLARIEGLLQMNWAANMASGSLGGPISPATSNTASDDLSARRVNKTTSMAASTDPPFTGMGTWSANISTMPKTHTTPALHLLQWPIIRDLVTRSCDPSELLQLEMTREPLKLDQQAVPDFSNAAKYAKAFFERVNVWYAVVDPHAWSRSYDSAVYTGFRAGPESCTVLLVLALGQAALSNESITTTPETQSPVGMAYFAKAWNIFPSFAVRSDTVTVQCHMLAAAYLMYLVRPLEAWNLLTNASMKLQLLLSAPKCIPASFKVLSERLFWDTLMIESDLLAELDLPHSGIVQFEESTNLPRSFQHDTIQGDDAPGTDDLWYFLAEIALRRLLNRVSHLIYTYRRAAASSIVTLEPVVAELEYQLTQWYDGLPDPIKFPRERTPARGQVQTVLRLRYFACRTIIYRPYVQAVLGNQDLIKEPGVESACRKCLEACLRQLEDLPAHHQGHLPYLWQGALSIMSQCLLLMGATLSGPLAKLLPPESQMKNMIAEVTSELKRMAHLAPSLRLCADIVKEAEQRRQMLSFRGSAAGVAAR